MAKKDKAKPVDAPAPSPAQQAQAQNDTELIQLRVDADHAARSLYISLMKKANGNKQNLLQAMAVAMNVIKNDVVALAAELNPPKKTGAKKHKDGKQPKK